MNDNTVAKELIKSGHDCVLMPVYTPIRTDVEDMSVDRVFLGGVNVFLAQKLSLFRMLPRWMIGWLDHPMVIKMLTAKAGKTSPELLGELAVSMLDGLDGRQSQEFTELLNFLQTNIRPDTILLTNLQRRCLGDAPRGRYLSGFARCLTSPTSHREDASFGLLHERLHLPFACLCSIHAKVARNSAEQVACGGLGAANRGLFRSQLSSGCRRG
jgi:hypothetical protein